MESALIYGGSRRFPRFLIAFVLSHRQMLYNMATPVCSCLLSRVPSEAIVCLHQSIFWVLVGPTTELNHGDAVYAPRAYWWVLLRYAQPFLPL